MRMERNSLRSNVRAMGAGRVLPFEDDQYLSSYILEAPAAKCVLGDERRVACITRLPARFVFLSTTTPALKCVGRRFSMTSGFTNKIENHFLFCWFFFYKRITSSLDCLHSDDTLVSYVVWNILNYYCFQKQNSCDYKTLNCNFWIAWHNHDSK